MRVYIMQDYKRAWCIHARAYIHLRACMVLNIMQDYKRAWCIHARVYIHLHVWWCTLCKTTNAHGAYMHVFIYTCIYGGVHYARPHLHKC